MFQSDSTNKQKNGHGNGIKSDFSALKKEKKYDKKMKKKNNEKSVSIRSCAGQVIILLCFSLDKGKNERKKNNTKTKL